MAEKQSHSFDEFLAQLIESNKLRDPFYVLHLDLLTETYKKWKSSLPRVVPFYAIKCNPSPLLLKSLATLGAGFDCASKEEIFQVLKLGVAPDRIVFANTVKMDHHIDYATNNGVHLYTFDHVSEMHKIIGHDPQAELLLRLKVEDRGSALRLGSKFGALPSEVDQILIVAKESNIPVIGIAFHVGSGATIGDNFTKAIATSREVFDKALEIGLPPMKMLDIGGGFSFKAEQFCLLDAAKFINKALDVHFPKDMNVKIIAEPGRYIAESVYTLATPIFGKKKRSKVIEYWLADGLHGGLNVTDLGLTTPRSWRILACASQPQNLSCNDMEQCMATVFGPTCDSTDIILHNCMLPELEPGDWLVWQHIGAYAQVMASNFNGFGPTRYSSFVFGHLV